MNISSVSQIVVVDGKSVNKFNHYYEWKTAITRTLSGALSPNLTSLHGVPSHQGCGWKPHRRRRAWEWGARLGTDTIIDRQDGEMDF
jgi:hypothetical protein